MNERIFTEPLIDKPRIPIVPIKDPLTEMSAEFGQFTRQQREWLLRRDTDPITGLVRCQFVGRNNGSRLIQCPVDERSAAGTRHLHAHHILPAGWFNYWFGEKKLGEEAEDSNQPWNGIILCEMFHHNGEKGIHPDYHQALVEYRQNLNSFKEVARNHHELIEHGIPYWNQAYDQILYEIARDRTGEYLERNPYDQWPLTK